MKLASLSFFVLLLSAHLTGDFESALGQALSTFRDGPRSWIGYALFAALLLVCLFYVIELTRSRRGTEAAFSCLALLVLLVVALTPSTDGFHSLCSLILFVLLFLYYALLLYRAEPLWLIAHLAVPIVLALVISFHSYGLWQKCFIAYFVFLTTAHHFALTLQRVEGDLSPLATCRKRRGRSGKRRTVHRLAMDSYWARRDAQTDHSRPPRHF